MGNGPQRDVKQVKRKIPAGREEGGVGGRQRKAKLGS